MKENGQALLCYYVMLYEITADLYTFIHLSVFTFAWLLTAETVDAQVLTLCCRATTISKLDTSADTLSYRQRYDVTTLCRCVCVGSRAARGNTGLN